MMNLLQLLCPGDSSSLMALSLILIRESCEADHHFGHRSVCLETAFHSHANIARTRRLVLALPTGRLDAYNARAARAMPWVFSSCTLSVTAEKKVSFEKAPQGGLATRICGTMLAVVSNPAAKEDFGGLGTIWRDLDPCAKEEIILPNSLSSTTVSAPIFVLPEGTDSDILKLV
nr:hypothetical protein Iba_chr05eCG8700 [Ipomoea batatas]